MIFASAVYLPPFQYLPPPNFGYPPPYGPPPGNSFYVPQTFPRPSGPIINVGPGPNQRPQMQIPFTLNVNNQLTLPQTPFDSNPLSSGANSGGDILPVLAALSGLIGNGAIGGQRNPLLAAALSGVGGNAGIGGNPGVGGNLGIGGNAGIGGSGLLGLGGNGGLGNLQGSAAILGGAGGGGTGSAEAQLVGSIVSLGNLVGASRFPKRPLKRRKLCKRTVCIRFPKVLTL